MATAAAASKRTAVLQRWTSPSYCDRDTRSADWLTIYAPTKLTPVYRQRLLADCPSDSSARLANWKNRLKWLIYIYCTRWPVITYVTVGGSTVLRAVHSHARLSSCMDDSKSSGWILPKFGVYGEYGPKRSWLNLKWSRTLCVQYTIPSAVTLVHFRMMNRPNGAACWYVIGMCKTISFWVRFACLIHRAWIGYRRSVRCGSRRIAEIPREQFDRSILVRHDRFPRDTLAKSPRGCHTMMLQGNCCRWISATLTVARRLVRYGLCAYTCESCWSRAFTACRVIALVSQPLIDNSCCSCMHTPICIISRHVRAWVALCILRCVSVPVDRMPRCSMPGWPAYVSTISVNCSCKPATTCPQYREWRPRYDFALCEAFHSHFSSAHITRVFLENSQRICATVRACQPSSLHTIGVSNRWQMTGYRRVYRI